MSISFVGMTMAAGLAMTMVTVSIVRMSISFVGMTMGVITMSVMCMIVAAALPVPVTIHRVTIAGVNLTVSIQSDVKQASCHQRFHAPNRPVGHARNQRRTGEEARRSRTNHRERHTPDCSNGTWCPLNRDSHCEADGKTVKHHCPRQ